MSLVPDGEFHDSQPLPGGWQISDVDRSASAPRSGSPPPGIGDLLDDYRRRREALRQEARQLAQLQAEVLGAAERDAGGILADARTAIAHILGAARRDLQTLSKRVQFIAIIEEEERAFRSSMANVDTHATQHSLGRVRHDLSRVLDESRPEIDALRSEAAKLGSAVPGFAPARPPGWRPAPDVEPRPIPQATDLRPVQPPSEAPPAQQPIETRPMQQPLDARLVQQLIETRPMPQPIEARPVPQPIETRPVQQPIELPPSLESEGFPSPEAIDVRYAPPFVTFSWPRSIGNALQNESARVWLVAIAIAAFVTILGATLVMRQSPAAAAPNTAPSKAVPTRPTSGVESGPESPQPPATPPLRSTPSGNERKAPAAVARPPGDQSRGSPLTSASPGDARSGLEPPAELTAAAERWLDAYTRQDAAALRSVGTSGMKLSDQRNASERLPAEAVSVRRTFENVSFLFVGGTSILAARLVEQGKVKGENAQRVSWISLMWIRDGSQWKISDVQILSDAKLRSR